MMSSLVSRRRLPVWTIAVAAAALAGCAGRSLNTPPTVVDWSSGALPALPATPSEPVFHTVRRDDTLATLARRYNTTPADIAAWNNLGVPARIRVDQVLRVSPPAPATPPAPEVAAPVAVPQPIGGGTVEERPLGTEPEAAPPPLVVPPPPAPPPVSNAPIKTGPLGIKRPFSDLALAELSKPDPDAPVLAANAAVAAPSAPSAGAVSWSWPASGKPSSTFGDGRTKGIDIPGKAGDAVLAAADGKVTFSGTGVRGYGNFVIVRHTPELLSVYAHNRANLVKEGAVVTKGQKIAEMGNSDTDTVKLHFEVRNDSKPVDPMKYLPER